MDVRKEFIVAMYDKRVWEFLDENEQELSRGELIRIIKELYHAMLQQPARIATEMINHFVTESEWVSMDEETELGIDKYQTNEYLNSLSDSQKFFYVSN